jgi:2-polyprenyl-3-methyl-5-hydroxy-6-metoxy-1,4-benzoquinol methylase
MRFNKEAHLWDEKPRRIELGKNVANYVKNYCDNKTILDFGCGTGLVSLNLCNAKKILGCDLSSEMVNLYNQKATLLKCNAKALCEDVINIDKKFDVIVANMVFHHIKDIQAMFKILYSKLNDNGYLFISDLYKEDGSFHDNGNDDVFHFGFEKEDFYCEYFTIINYQKIYTIQKHKKFEVYIAQLKVKK